MYMTTRDTSAADLKISAYIKRHQKDRGVTQAAMAKAAGRTQSYISAHMNGEWSWGVNDIAAIAPLFGFHSIASFLSEALNER